MVFVGPDAARLSAVVSRMDGAVSSRIPATLPAMAQLLGADPASLARAVPALFTGLFLGVALAPTATRRAGPTRAAASGAGVQAVALGLASLAWSEVAVVLAAATAGVRFGLAESSGITLARLRGDSTANAGTSRSLVALTAAAAAATAPLLIEAGGTTAVRPVLAGTALLHLLAALVLATATTAPPQVPVPTRPAGHAPRKGWLAAAVFCYVGSETVIAGWSALLPQDVLALSPSTAATGTSAFWVLLLLGRLAGSTAITSGARPRTALAACQLGASVALAGGAATAPVSTGVSLVLLAVAIALMGPCYGLLLGTGLDAVPDDQAGHLSARLITLGALGGAVCSGLVSLSGGGITWLAGSACIAMVASAAAPAEDLRSCDAGTRDSLEKRLDHRVQARPQCAAAPVARSTSKRAAGFNASRGPAPANRAVAHRPHHDPAPGSLAQQQDAAPHAGGHTAENEEKDRAMDRVDRGRPRAHARAARRSRQARARCDG